MFNVNALEFIKMKQSSNKDTMFMIGLIIGLDSSLKMMAEKNGLSPEEASMVVNDILSDEKINSIWSDMEAKLELELNQSPLDIGIIKK